MIPAALPPDEDARLVDVHELGLLDTPAEERFDRITRLAARTFGTPIAAISLIDTDRQWFMSEVGLEVRQTGRDEAFCAHTILDDTVMVVPDAHADPRFVDNPLVTEDPHIRFYAGAPVHADNGRRLGAVCVIDRERRDWTEADSRALQDLARLVEQELGTSRVEARHEAMAALTTIASLTSEDSRSLLETGLRIASDYLDLPIAKICNHTAEDVSIEVEVKMASRIGDEARRAVLEYRVDPGMVIALHQNAGSDLGLMGGDEIEALLAVGLSVDGRRYGTLVFLGRRSPSYGEFTEDDIRFARLIALWAEGVLARRNAQVALDRRRSLLGVIRQAQSAFISSTDKSAAFTGLLQDIVDLTGSESGIIAEYVTLPDGEKSLRTRALSDISWDDHSRDLFREHEERGLHYPSLGNLIGAGLHPPAPVVANNPRTDRRSGGLPEGHPALEAYLGLPLQMGDEVIGILGLANRPGGYSVEDADYLEPLSATIAQLVSAISAQEAHRQTQREIARLSTVVRQMSTCVLINDLDGRIQWTNESFGRLFGYQTDEVVGLRPRDVFHTAGTERESEVAIRAAMERRQEFEAELRVIDRTGRRFWVAVSSAVLTDEGGEPEGYVVLVDDIDERKRLDQMKSDFLSAVSHELRTPLTSISGSLGLLAGGAAGPLPERAVRMIEIAQQNSSRLTILINDLLDLERLAAGGLPIDAEPHDIENLVEQAVDDNQAYAVKLGCRVVRGARMDATVLVDSVRFVQVMSNLLSNGAKYSPEGGEVLVDVRQAGDLVIVEVSDEGPGVPTEFVDRLFDRFAQADGSDARMRGGSGLGLAISKELVERMDGIIGYRDRVGGGSVFWFALPITGERRHADRRSSSDRRQSRG